MKNKTNAIVFGAFGVIAILFGMAGLIWPSRIEPTLAWRGIHILREQGAALVFVGLVSFWCVFNQQHRRAVHYFLIIFAALISLIHWFDYLQGNLPTASPILNSIPLMALLLLLFVDRGERKPA